MNKMPSPESVGIPSKSLLSLMDQLETLAVPIHSLIISRHNQIILESYYAPFTKDTLHRMFSVSKSFTSMAIGQLELEGYLSLNDPIAQYFPEMIPQTVHPYILTMTIKDLLQMTTCHTKSTYKIQPESHWVESFFKSKPSHTPGTVFNYDTSASHTLAALVERLSGKSLLDYLRHVCLRQIEFSQEAYIIKDPFGVSMGGSGLMAKPMDIMVFAQLLMNQGRYKGSSLLSSDFIEAATHIQSTTFLQGSFPETRFGYGYQFWINRQEGFSLFGMGGQLAICLPKEDLIMVTTGDTQGMNGGNQFIYNSLYDCLLPDLSETPLSEAPDHLIALQTRAKSNRLQAITTKLIHPSSTFVNNRCYSLKNNPFAFDNFMLHLDTDGAKGTLHYDLNGRSHELAFGLDAMITAEFPIYQQRCATSGGWIQANTFYIKSHLIDECLGSVHWHITFHQQYISIFMKKIEESSFNEYQGYLEGEALS